MLRPARPLRRARARRCATRTRRSPASARISTAAPPAARSTRACGRSSAANKFSSVRTSAARHQIVMTQTTFYGLSLLIPSGRVMRPRPASEQLVATALAFLRGGPAKVVDVGTGSGAVAIAIAAAPAGRGMGHGHEPRRRRRRRARTSRRTASRTGSRFVWAIFSTLSRRDRPRRREPSVPSGRRCRALPRPGGRAARKRCSPPATASIRTGAWSKPAPTV